MNKDEIEYYSLTRRVFRILAPVYNLLVIPLTGLRKNVAGTVTKTQANILDVATDTGKQATAYAERGHNVIGVDISSDMLAVAMKKKRLPNLNFEHGDATQLRFENDTFDVTSISFALHEMPLSIRERVLKEMVR